MMGCLLSLSATNQTGRLPAPLRSSKNAAEQPRFWRNHDSPSHENIRDSETMAIDSALASDVPCNLV